MQVSGSTGTAAAWAVSKTATNASPVATISDGAFSAWDLMSPTERNVLGAASGMPLDTEGRPVGDIESPQYRDFARLANQVAFDRLSGRLKTEVSADYIANLARTSSTDPSSRLNADMLDRALQILSGARSSSAADYPLDVRA